MTTNDAIRVNGPRLELHGKLVAIWTGDNFDRDEIEVMGLWYQTEDQRAEELQAAEVKGDKVGRNERTEEIFDAIDKAFDNAADEVEANSVDDMHTKMVLLFDNILSDMRDRFPIDDLKLPDKSAKK